MIAFDSQHWVRAYGRAQAMMLARHKVRNATIYPRWFADGKSFWYERQTDAGLEYRIVDAAAGDNRLAFSLKSAADALRRKLDAPIDPDMLILKNLKIELNPLRASFEAFGKHFAFDFDLAALEETKSGADGWWPSPDQQKFISVRDHNLWLREGDKERALTGDGTETYAYAARPLSARGIFSIVGDKPEGIWSPDSKYFLTLQTDDRHVPPLHVIDFTPTEGVRPIVSGNNTSLPGDAQVTEFRIVAIDTETGRQIEARYPRLTAVRMNDTPFSAGVTWWSADGRTAYFVDIERGEQAAHVVAFDVTTGATHIVFSERTDTYLELGVDVYARTPIYALPGTDELVWYSERSGHAHLYLYDFVSGVLKRQITSGPWQVRDVIRVDEARREIFFLAAGIAAGEDPYIAKPCIVSIDGGDTLVVSPEPGEHIVWHPEDFRLVTMATQGGDRFAVCGLSPNGEYFVESIGSSAALPVAVLRRRDGEKIAVIEQADGLPSDWQWPEPVKLLAADGKTDIYGILFKPPGFEPKDSYPVIDLIYGGPQKCFVTKIAFAEPGLHDYYCDAASLATIGAFVLILDGRGTAYRERAFRDASYGAIHTASNIEDHIAGLRQLAGLYPAMDLQRAAICGNSGGGYMTAVAALRFGDFFKVAVASSGNYDQGLFWHTWSERYHGLFEEEHYRVQAPRSYAAGLKGKIMFIHGLMDTGCHPAGLFQLIQALVDENKDYELVIVPRAPHEQTGYGLRRRLDFFVKNLFHSDPPEGVKLTTVTEALARKLAANASPPK